MSSNANNTTSGDNSSDSASNKNNNTTKSQLEIVEQKLKKCSNEIETLRKRYEREWSAQMNKHLESFYDDNIKMNTLSSNKLQTDSPQNTKKRIDQLTHKLQTYEKRKQQLLDVQAKENHDLIESNHDLNHDVNSHIDSTPASSLLIALNNSASNSNLNGATNNNNTNQSIPLQASSSLPINKNLTNINNNNNNNNTLSNRTASFNKISLNNTNDNEQNLSQIKSTGNNNGIGDDKIIFDNPDPFNNFNNNNNNIENYQSEEQSSTNEVILANYKAILHLISKQEHEIDVLRSQHVKIQNDLDELQKKTDESHKTVFKEIQDGFKNTRLLLDGMNQSLVFNYLKPIEQKFDEFKQSTSQSFDSLRYNFSRFQSDVKDIKDDVTFMKNRVEIVEENKQKNAHDSNPANNWYQLFYKLLDIFLTLATIVLLAFTNLIASIKFIFLLYPRSIVILLFFYFLFFYLVDHNKLLLLFLNDSSLINNNDQQQHFDNNHNQFSSNFNNNDFSLQSNLTYFGKLFRSIYKLIFNLRRTTPTATTTSAST